MDPLGYPELADGNRRGRRRDAGRRESVRLLLCGAPLHREAPHNPFGRSDPVEASITTGDTPSHWHAADGSRMLNTWLERIFGLRLDRTASTSHIRIMNKKPLEVLFNAMHHGKYKYEDFLNDRVSENYSVKFVGRSSKPREVLVPNKRLKAYLTFLNLFVFEYLPVCKEVVFSYRKGAAVVQAVEVHRKSKYFLQIDIKDFFSSIDRSLVEGALFNGWQSTPVLDLVPHGPRILDLVCVDDRIPLGFPTSSPISNAVLFNFDCRILDYCKSLGISYSRYSDDLIFSSDSPNLEACLTNATALLASETSERLVINPAKTKFFQTGGRIKILGMMILPNEKVTIDSKIKSDLEVMLHFYTTDRAKFVDRVDGDEKKGAEKTAGYLSYANSVDPDYVNRLRRKFGASIVDMFLHRTYPQ